MTKVSINVILKDDDNCIVVSNSNGKTVSVDTNNGNIKASDIFQLFNYGFDVCYSCEDKKLEPEEGTNLSKNELMFNDLLELMGGIIDSVNEKIGTYNNLPEGNKGNAEENK